MIADLSYSELSTNQINYVDKLFEIEYDAVIIRNVFDKNKVDAIKNQIDIYSNKKYTKSFGNILGYVLHNSNNFEEYIAKAKQFNEDLNKMLDFDFKFWYKALFASLNHSIPLSNAQIDGNELLSANIKLMDAGLKGLEPHSELSLYKEITSIAILKQIMNTHEQLSFYIQISKPKTGGRLILYNFFFKDNFINKLPIHHPLIRIVLLFKKKKIIELNEGDAILFNAGRIWHKIEDLKGDKKRITLQNFINLSSDKKSYLYWT